MWSAALSSQRVTSAQNPPHFNRWRCQLARRYGDESWLPLEAEPLSLVVRWLSTTAGEIRQGPESARLYHLFKATSINLERVGQKAEFILTQLNAHLAEREWLELGHPTIADVAVFPYVALAPDGKISLDNYANILTWIKRVKHLPGFVGMSGIAEPIPAGAELKQPMR
ncbi:MAG: hypothetical protein AB1589_35765 [Cyanobacteriota bacterium]